VCVLSVTNIIRLKKQLFQLQLYNYSLINIILNIFTITPQNFIDAILVISVKAQYLTIFIGVWLKCCTPINFELFFPMVQLICLY
jgi:hypothetical protein